jgi:hypothetical protein
VERRLAAEAVGVTESADLEEPDSVVTGTSPLAGDRRLASDACCVTKRLAASHSD